MKKVLLVFCVIVGVANGECGDYCITIDCVNKCEKEDTVKSLTQAIDICARLDFLKRQMGEQFVGQLCGSYVVDRLRRRKRELEQQAQEQQEQQTRQEQQARYAKCRNGNADACFDIGYEELSKCEEVSCNQTEALTYFSKSCNLKNKVGCFNTAVILEQNLFFKNPTKAQEYYRKSCNMGYEPACFKVK